MARVIKKGLIKMEQDVRGNWGSKAEFILACMGYAIGIGNVVRFPYVCYRNGGGAFLLPYILCLIFCGIPLFFLETSIGQFSSTGCITMFNICPIFKGAGIATILVNLYCALYYNILLSYAMLYFTNCFQDPLPWENCDNPWNTLNCFQTDFERSTNVTTNGTSAAEEFFHYRILQISNGIDQPGNIVWQLCLCDLISWIIIFTCIMNGVKSVGKVVYFTATFPFIILLALFLRGITLSGAKEGILFYISPQWETFSSFQVWSEAAKQLFFSLGPGWGGLINMASFNRFKNNNKKDSIFVPIMNSVTSIFAGFVVFSVLGFMSEQTGKPVTEVAAGV